MQATLNGTATLVPETAERFTAESFTLESPFAAAQLSAAPEAEAPQPEQRFSAALESPFAEAVSWGEASEAESLAAEIVAELEDEEFTEALEALADEAAARHLTASASWTSHAEAPALATSEAEAWMEGVASEADRLLERLEQMFGSRTLESLAEGEMEDAGARVLAEAGPLGLATEQFLGKLIKKAGKLVKGAVNIAKKGIAAVSKFLPLGKLWKTLRGLVRPLLQRVLKAALNKLPPQVRPIAQKLAQKLLGQGESETAASVPTILEIGEAFDVRLAEALLAPTDTEAEQLMTEAEYEAAAESPDSVAALDVARARLARQLNEAVPGASPVAQMEQFIPVVMAALPLIKLGITIIGRDRVVGFLADRLADLIKSHIGADAAKAISRPIVDVGLRLLTLEAEASAPGNLGAEALVATVEDTVRQVMELPAEALENRTLMEAEIQEAFSAAAARHLPRMLLRPGLPGIETVQGAGVWMMMPRRTQPCFRYKKYSNVYPVSIHRPVARNILLPAGDTLERRLLDAGAASWPVQAEVHLFEAIPGTQLGHLAAFESEGSLPEAVAATDEFEILTPEVAAMLVNEPGQGRTPAQGARQLRPGARLFRLKIAGRRVRRTKRFILRLDASGAAPVLKLHLRLSEREAHMTAESVAKGQQTAVVSNVKQVMGPAFEAALAGRLQRHLAEKAGGAMAPGRAAALAKLVSEGALTSFGAGLQGAAPKLAQAAKDPAPGITLTFEFRFSDKAALLSGTPGRPVMTIRGGHHSD
jgi:hypothetical protein